MIPVMDAAEAVIALPTMLPAVTMSPPVDIPLFTVNEFPMLTAPVNAALIPVNVAADRLLMVPLTALKDLAERDPENDPNSAEIVDDKTKPDMTVPDRLAVAPIKVEMFARVNEPYSADAEVACRYPDKLAEAAVILPPTERLLLVVMLVA